jgi:small subunit ribosomal protein S8
MRHDLISDVLSSLKNGDNGGRRETLVPYSNMVKGVLMILQKHGFIGDFEFVDDKKGGKLKVTLLGKINDCNSIRPRFYVKKDDYSKWEKRYLPAIGMGFIIISTNKGLMVHEEAKEKKIGGSLLAFVY